MSTNFLQLFPKVIYVQNIFTVLRSENVWLRNYFQLRWTLMILTLNEKITGSLPLFDLIPHLSTINSPAILMPFKLINRFYIRLNCHGEMIDTFKILIVDVHKNTSKVCNRQVAIIIRFKCMQYLKPAIKSNQQLAIKITQNSYTFIHLSESQPGHLFTTVVLTTCFLYTTSKQWHTWSVELNQYPVRCRLINR